MRKIAFILLTLMLVAGQTVNAQFFGFGGNRKPAENQDKEEQAEHRTPQFSPEEFRNRQQKYLTDKSGLTEDEAGKFFPIYFELQQKKNEINANARQTVNMRSESGHLSDEEYTKLIDNLADAKIRTAKLEKEYLEKFKKIVPAGKLLRIQIAETQFASDMIKEMQRPAQHNMMGLYHFPGTMNMHNPMMQSPFPTPFGFQAPGNGNNTPTPHWPMQPMGQGSQPTDKNNK